MKVKDNFLVQNYGTPIGMDGYDYVGVWFLHKNHRVVGDIISIHTLKKHSMKNPYGSFLHQKSLDRANSFDILVDMNMSFSFAVLPALAFRLNSVIKS